MNPKHFNIRMNRDDGAFWLTEERYNPGKPRIVKRIKDMTEALLLSFCADLYEKEGTREVRRTVTFPSGATAEIVAREIVADKPEDHYDVVCPRCGSDDITVDATARWDPHTQRYEMSTHYDRKTCGNCGHESNYMEHKPLNQKG